MRLHGKKIEGLNLVTIVIPRGDGEDIVLKAQAILSYDAFEALCPVPKAKTIIRKGGIKEADTRSPGYQKQMEDYASKKVAFMVVQSLAATEGLEWDTVNIDDPDTWKNYRTELESAGFSDAEQVRIFGAVMEAQGLNDAKIEAARNNFLAGVQAASLEQSSLTEDQAATQSGEPASDSE